MDWATGCCGALRNTGQNVCGKEVECQWVTQFTAEVHLESTSVCVCGFSREVVASGSSGQGSGLITACSDVNR